MVISLYRVKMSGTASNRGNGVTLRSVAKRAGVNCSTVSRILSGKSGFSATEECRLRVIKIAEELQYHPKFSAKSLVSGKSFNVNLLLGDITTGLMAPSLAAIVETISRELKRRGYHLVITPVTVADLDAMTQEVREILASCAVDGTIIAGGLLNKKLGEQFDINRIPAVLLDLHTREEDFGCFPFIHHLAYDENPGQEELLGHLVGLGHRRLAYIKSGAYPDIMGAFAGAVRKYGFDFSDRDIFHFDDWPSGKAPRYPELQMYFHRRTAENWDALKRYSAIACTSAAGAVGVIEFLKDKGLTAGKDVSVVGYGNFEQDGPDVTTIDKSWVAAGRMAVEILMDAINRPGKPVGHVKIPTKLLIGSTTGSAVRCKAQE